MKERLQDPRARRPWIAAQRRSADHRRPVTVNGARVTELGTTAGAALVASRSTARRSDFVRAGVPGDEQAGQVPDVRERPTGRRTVIDLYPPTCAHVFPIGRLDRDRAPADKRRRVQRIGWRIRASGWTRSTTRSCGHSADALRRLRQRRDRGRALAGRRRGSSGHAYGHTARAGYTWLRLIIHEGRRRQVRLMCAAVGHPVSALLRTRIGDVLLGRLATGKTRQLSRHEVASLKAKLGLDGGPDAIALI
jgi:16S rRNA U516 pseudouridylate synthase RsuA-like enzyme